MRRAQVTTDDLSGFLEDLTFFGDKTEQVLDDRISRPLPGHVVEIALDRLDPDPLQPRRTFDEHTLLRLRASIEDQGILQPLVVRPGERGRYMIIAGERRFRAARGILDTLPCSVRQCTQEQALIIALMENVHRDGLTDIEKSDALVRLKELTGKTWEDLSDLVRLSPDRVRSLAGLQALAEPVKKMVREGGLSGRKALAVRPLPPDKQIVMVGEAEKGKWSAEEIRARVQQQLGKPKKQQAPEPAPEEGEHVTRNMPLQDSPSGAEPAPEESEHVTRNMSLQDSPSGAEPEPRHIPALVSRCRSAVQDTLQLLRSVGASAVDSAYASEFLRELKDLQAILEEG